VRSEVRRLVVGPRPWWLEAAVVFAVYQAYDWARGALHGSPSAAMHHALQLVDVERALGMFHEATVQHWFLPSHPAIEAFDAYYGTIHFVIPPLVLVLLWRRNRPRYTQLRNAFGWMLALALVGFAFWPLTPPRLLPRHYGFEDTAVTIGGLGPLDRGSMKDDNLYAAMPSLHIGWSTWCVVAGVPVLRRRRAKLLVAAYPFVTLFVVVVTANHYVLDGAGGLVALGGGLAIERALRGRVAGRRPPGPARPPSEASEPEVRAPSASGS
jgi:hypothetical protein